MGPLHYHTLGAASRLLISTIYINGLERAVPAAATSRETFHLSVVSPNLSHKIVESLVDIDSGLG